ncbi:MAG: 5'-nucleotidase [Fibrobacteria bacterium]|nr:5'-nucleotidase [Fibrobacteria bacterium]
MPYPIEDKLVIAVASSAIFDLGEADTVFTTQGEDSYRKYTREKETSPFKKGPAFTFIQNLLSVNNPQTQFEPIEVILLSKNDADTGNRVFNSLQHYKLPITRAAFTCGRKPFTYLSSFKASLFLSANKEDVIDAVREGWPAGIIMASGPVPENTEPGKEELKLAFDFDGIIADDSSEQVYQKEGLDGFQRHEKALSNTPLSPGPLMRLLEKISGIQQKEFEKQKTEPHYKPKIRTAIITSRMAPAHQRVIHTLRHWGIHIDQAFFMGGISKSNLLSELQPHIFFDDQLDNLSDINASMAMVHVPYGVINR